MIYFNKIKIKEIIETGVLPEEIVDFLREKICLSFEKLDKGDNIFNKEKFLSTFKVSRFKNIEKSFFLYFIFSFDFIKEERIQVVFYYDEKFKCGSISIVAFQSKDLSLFRDFKELPFVENKGSYEISFKDYEVSEIEVSYGFKNKINIFDSFFLKYKKNFENVYDFNKERQYMLSLHQRTKSSKISSGIRSYSNSLNNFNNENNFIKFLNYIYNESFNIEEFNNVIESSNFMALMYNENYKFEDLKRSLNYIFENIKENKYEESFKFYDLLTY